MKFSTHSAYTNFQSLGFFGRFIRHTMALWDRHSYMVDNFQAVNNVLGTPYLQESTLLQ